MTTPPDTPKPPAELFIIPPQGREVVGDAFVDAGTATRAMKDRKASTVHRYILAPSPQESHKLAEELEAALRALDNAGIDGEIDSAESDVLNVVCPPNNREIILAALRSSPSEQDARDAERYRAIRNNTWNDVLCAALGKRVYGAETLVARGIALDSAADAIAASGGAKGDGNG